MHDEAGPRPLGGSWTMDSFPTRRSPAEAAFWETGSLRELASTFQGQELNQI